MSLNPQNLIAAPDAWQLSSEVRREQAILRSYIHNGASLAAMIRFEYAQLERVELRKLVRWVPFIGNVKAARILIGLPERARLCELDAEQRELLTRRLENQERRILNNRRIPYQHEEARS